MKKLQTSYLMLILSLALLSCKKEIGPLDNADAAVFPTTPELIEKASLIKEVTEVLKKVYENRDAVDEVNGAIYAGLEPDESISIEQLLRVGSSRLFRHPKFTAMPIRFGTFNNEFRKAYSQGRFPLIDKFYGVLLNHKPASSERVSVQHSVMVGSPNQPEEVFLVNNVKIYFPYSEDWEVFHQPGRPGINNPNLGARLVTLVAADREADFGLGNEPYIYPPSGPGTKELRWRQITVGDDYAEVTKPTHIINVGDQVMDPLPPVVPPITNVKIYKVFIGWVRCTKKDYDKFISIENGGGPELRFGRGYASVDASGRVATGFPFVPANLSRKDCKKGRWKQVLSLWDTNWGVNKVEQALGIYEEDTKGTQTISSTVAYTANGQTYTTGVSSTKSSQDAVIRNMGIDRDFFFATGTFNQGWGFQSSWPIYDGNATVSFTMPYEIIN